MRTRLRNIYLRLEASFWFIPALMACAAIAMAYAATALDRALPHEALAHHWWRYQGDPDGARTVLSVIASSMITVAGVVFSITIVVLTLASSQFGSRLIRNFMHVRANQIVLGIFVATFIYCLLVLRTVNAMEGKIFVPGLAVSGAFLMALLSLSVLIYFIHSVSESIQAQHIISRVRRDLDKAVQRIFPEKIGEEENASSGAERRDYVVPTTCDREACFVKAGCSGYLQTIDHEALMQVAVEENLLIHLACRPGHFITKGSALVTVWPGTKVDEVLSRKINAVFEMGPERTLAQDVEYAISQLVEIAVRALSPGINDPFTAITCIDWLGAMLCQLSHRKLPASHRYDKHNRLRVVIGKSVTFEGLVDAAFNMIRQNAQANAAVSIHLLETLATFCVRLANDKQQPGCGPPAYPRRLSHPVQR